MRRIIGPGLHNARPHARAVSSAEASPRGIPSLARGRAVNTAWPRPLQSRLRPLARFAQFAVRASALQGLENRLGPHVREAEIRNGAGSGSGISARDLIQYLSRGGSVECRVYDKALDIVLQVDGPMNLRFHARIQDPPRRTRGRIYWGQRELLHRISRRRGMVRFSMPNVGATNGGQGTLAPSPLATSLSNAAITLTILSIVPRRSIASACSLPENVNEQRRETARRRTK